MIEAPRHGLDEAIDRVAAKIMAIDDDAGALQAVMSRLPERESRPWFLPVPVQLAAGAALVLIAFVWARPSDPQGMPIALAPIAATAPPMVTARLVEPASFRPVVRIPDPESRLRRGFGRQARIPASTIDRPDHERSLAPVPVIEAIELVEIAAPAIELATPALLEPLVLTDLSLATKGDS